jgi:surface antigen
MERTYTAAQIYDSMIRQGFDEQAARIMSMAVGSNRVTPEQLRSGYQKLGISGARMPAGSDGEQGSNLLTNASEAVGGYAGYAAGHKYFKPNPNQTGLMAPAKKFGRFAMRNAVLPGTVGMLASTGANLLSGTNYYDTATTGQLLADMGGSLAGGIIGEKLGDAAVNRAKDAVRSAAAKHAAGQVAGQGIKGLGGRLAGRAAAGLIGRGLGGTIGMLGGPAGSIALGTALGYLLPKLIPGAPESVEEEDRKRRRQPGYENPFE